MFRGYTLHGSSLLVTACIAAALAVLAWRRRSVPCATRFVLIMLAVAEWSLGYALELGAPDLAGKIMWAKLEYVGIAGLPLTWLIFGLEYAGRGRWLTRRNLAFLAVIPTIIVMLVWTNDFHGLIWRNTALVSYGSFSALDVTYGPGFWFHTAYSYSYLLLGTIFLIRALQRSWAVFRKQGLVLLAGALAPWLGNIVFLSDLVPLSHLDPTPFAFTVTGLLWFWGLFRFRLLEIVPVARDAIFESMEDAVIVVDARNRVVDVNPAALDLIGRKITDVIGQPIIAVFPDQAGVIRRFETASEARSAITVGDGDERSSYDLRISPLSVRRGELAGRLVVLRDISELMHAEAALQRAHRELEQRVEERTAELRAANQDKEVLLKEIHHRVKNNLQIISSLLNMQSERVEDAHTLEILRDSKNRVRSMALIHERLYQSQDLARIQFAQYVKSLAAHLFRTYGSRANDVALRVVADDIDLGIDTAVPCGLLLNELMSNSLKYAFPEGRGGKIWVEFRVQDGRSCTLRIGDNGVGLPEGVYFGQTGTLGMQLVSTLVSQLDGIVELDSSNGTDFTIRFEALER